MTAEMWKNIPSRCKHGERMMTGIASPDGGPYPASPSGKSQTGSGEKFFHNAILGAEFAAQPYYVATRGL